MTTLWIVTPAFQRLALSEVCFAQHAWVHEQLAERGIKSTSVVIADDENLELARAHGFATIEHPNHLGAKFNAGYRFAAAEGVEYVMALGSDSWVALDRFDVLPGWAELVVGKNYAVVSADGRLQMRCQVKFDGGLGSRIMQTQLLAGCDWAPCPPDADRNCDTETLRALRASVGWIDLVWHDVHPLDVVGFQSEQQLTTWRSLRGRRGGDDLPGYEGLAEHFPQDLVDRVAAYHGALVS